jgi:hypothetical protein
MLDAALPVVVPALQAPEPRRSFENRSAHEEQLSRGTHVSALQDPAVTHLNLRRAAVGAAAPILRTIVHQSSKDRPSMSI